MNDAPNFFDFNELAGTCMAALGLNIKEFYELTPIELHYALTYVNKRDEVMAEIVRNNIWESMRVQTTLLYNMLPYKKKPIDAPQKLIRFAWDKARPMKVQTPEEMKQVLMGFVK